MHGIVTGAIFGMAFVAFMGAWRSLQNWKSSKDRPSKLRLYVQLAGQVILGVLALAFGLWFLFFGG